MNAFFVFLRIEMINYPLQLLLAEILFGYGLSKRKGYPFFLAASCVLILLLFSQYVVLLRSNEELSQWIKDVSVVFFVLLCFLAMLLWCKSSFKEILFRFTGAYALQNMLYNVYTIVHEWWDIQLASNLSLGVIVLCIAVLYTVMFFWFIRRLGSKQIDAVNNMRSTVVSICVLIITVFLSSRVPEDDRFFYRICVVVMDFLILFIQFGLLNEGKLEQQNQIMEQLLYAERKQHEMSKENVALINRKCHDLKHQIAAWKIADASHDEFISEVERAVQIYDNNVNTGNEALDVVLMEKLLYCENYKIKLTYLADGASLHFIKAYDISSLFGNALDNAIEYVKSLPEEKRIVSFKVGRQNALLCIHFENYFEGNLNFVNGLPQTTKEDKDYHGFGMMSMEYVVRRYNGTMSIQTEDGLFILNLLIPIPETVS